MNIYPLITFFYVGFVYNFIKPINTKSNVKAFHKIFIYNLINWLITEGKPAFFLCKIMVKRKRYPVI